MLAFKPDRFGHCCYLNKAQIKQVVEDGIPVELCPTSNVATTQCGLPAFLPHLKEFYDQDHNLVICCDDTLLFSTNLSMEWFEFCKAVQLTDSSKIKTLIGRNLDAIFMPDKEDFKTKVIAEIESKY